MKRITRPLISLIALALPVAIALTYVWIGGPAVAEETTSAAASGSHVGLAMLGAAISAGLASIGAAYAVGMVGSAAVGAMVEKPELLGRLLILVGLAEGIAIYGLIVAVLILNAV